MKNIVPCYYLSFKCTASGCRHNCCREGWEISIDDTHASRYKQIASDPADPCAEMLGAGIFFPTVRERREGLRPHIRLQENGECPFLCRDGLCRLIREYGQDILCQVCADHPRFRNFYPDHTETGIGLCCEEAVRLILAAELPLRYLDLHTGEPAVPEHRKNGREAEYMNVNRKKLDISSMAGYLLNLDCLEPEWQKMLRSFLSGSGEKAPAYTDASVWNRIEEYLLYRHLRKDGAGFVSFSMELIRGLYGCGDVLPGMRPEERITEILRIFSSETEYSEEAMETVKQRLYR